MPTTRRLTMGQAIVEFLTQQHTSLDGVEQPFFAGVTTIFGHGNVAGIGQALLQARDRLPVFFPRNEQAMVHTASPRWPTGGGRSRVPVRSARARPT